MGGIVGPLLRWLRPSPTIVGGAGLNGSGPDVAAAGNAAVASSAADDYIELMKKCLINSIYRDSGRVPPGIVVPFSPKVREEGRDWPEAAHTMVGRRRLDNVHRCVEDVLARAVPGDLIETGVWRGGTTILMRAILRARADATRTVWVADSFEGVPPPDAARYPADTGLNLHRYQQLSIPIEEVRANFEAYGLLDNQVRFLKGWFKDTLLSAPIKQLALIRLDGDLYESTFDALSALYPSLSAGGYVIIDDYGAMEACHQAVDDYRERHGIEEQIVPIDWAGAFWKRAGPP